MTPEEVLAFIKQNNIQIVDLKFNDLPGLWQHFSMPAGELTERGHLGVDLLGPILNTAGLVCGSVLTTIAPGEKLLAQVGSTRADEQRNHGKNDQRELPSVTDLNLLNSLFGLCAFIQRHRLPPLVAQLVQYVVAYGTVRLYDQLYSTIPR